MQGNSNANDQDLSPGQPTALKEECQKERISILESIKEIAKVTEELDSDDEETLEFLKEIRSILDNGLHLSKNLEACPLK